MSGGREKKRDKETNLGKVILGRRGYGCRELLGQGTFSSVYCVESRWNNKIYACKISEKASLLEKEAEVMSLLVHPLFPVYSAFWQEAGLGFLLREYIPGNSLEELLARKRYFSVEETVRTGLELAEGLCYLHERPEFFLFRDVKPANVIVGRDGGVKLIDLGCVCSGKEKITSRAGTPGFAAPEQLKGQEQLTASCDVYGLGQTLKAMPGREKNVLFFGGRRRRRLEKILDACTMEDASERMSGMRDVMKALQELW